MQVFQTAQDVQRWRQSLPADRKVALVPTMGFLHEGHLSLVDEARRRVGEGEVVLSVFVNPTQFGPGEDLDSYPRDLKGDLEKAEARGVSMAFCPEDPATVYPTRQTWVSVDELDTGLCGGTRPGHFRGVCTVVTKLWNLVLPDYGVFGRKDYQQLAIIRRMHADLFMRGEIVAMPVVRDADGLAMSSRNANLSNSDREQARRIPRFLELVAKRFADGERVRDALLEGAPQALMPGHIDYVELADAATLRPIDRVEAPAVCAVAVQYGAVRLIDNTLLAP